MKQQKLCLKSKQVAILSATAEISVLSLISNFFCHEDSQAVQQVGRKFMQSPSQEVFNTRLGKALRSLVSELALL